MNKILSVPFESVKESGTKTEQRVASFLDGLGLFYHFEHPVFIVDDKNRPRIWAPDFFLPELGVYLEVCGSEDFDYEYRKKIYASNKIQVVFIHAFKKKLWCDFLLRQLKEIQLKRDEIIISIND